MTIRTIKQAPIKKDMPVVQVDASALAPAVPQIE